MARLFLVSVAIRICFVDTNIRFQSTSCVSHKRFNNYDVPFPRPGPPEQSSPLSSVLWDTKTSSTYYPVTYGFVPGLLSAASYSLRQA